MRINSGRAFLDLLVLMWFAIASTGATAQTYPERPVTVIVAVAAGGLTDVLTRAVSQRLAEKWGQPVIVENRPGGGYQVAARSVLAAPADGYTLFAAGNGLISITPHLYNKTKLTYAPKDFVPVADLGGIPLALLTSSTFPAKTISELIALAKRDPRAITYGASGPGTSPHMAMLLLESLTGIQLTAVHYRGIGPAVTDLMTGQINLLAIGPTVALPAYRAGKLGMIGVGSSARCRVWKGFRLLQILFQGSKWSLRLAFLLGLVRRMQSLPRQIWMCRRYFRMRNSRKSFWSRI